MNGKIEDHFAKAMLDNTTVDGATELAEMEMEVLRNIAYIFSPCSVKKVVNNNRTEIKKIFKLAMKNNVIVGKECVSEFYEKIYVYLSKEYKNEYFYKNILANKLFIKKDKILKNSNFFTEFDVKNSIADVVIVKRHSTVYEIKTEFDNLSRLEKQINDYKKVFEYIYLVIPHSKLCIWESKIPKSVGIYVLTENNSLRKIRRSESHLSSICNFRVINCLRKNEILKIVKEHFGYLPTGEDVFVQEQSRKMLFELDEKDLYKYFVAALRNRRIGEDVKSLIEICPKPLRSAVLSAKPNNKQAKFLINIFEKDNYVSSLFTRKKTRIVSAN